MRRVTNGHERTVLLASLDRLLLLYISRLYLLTSRLQLFEWSGSLGGRDLLNGLRFFGVLLSVHWQSDYVPTLTNEELYPNRKVEREDVE